jgi:hypothetical protein
LTARCWLFVDRPKADSGHEHSVQLIAAELDSLDDAAVGAARLIPRALGRRWRRATSLDSCAGGSEKPPDF